MANLLAISDWTVDNLDFVGHVIVNDDAVNIAQAFNDNGSLPFSFNGVFTAYVHFFNDDDPVFTAQSVPGADENTFVIPQGVTATIDNYWDDTSYFELPDLVNDEGFDPNDVVFGPYADDGNHNIDVSYDGANTVIDVYENDGDAVVDTTIILNGVNVVDRITEYDFWGLRGGEQEPPIPDGSYTFSELFAEDTQTLIDASHVVVKDEPSQIYAYLFGQMGDVAGHLGYIDELVVEEGHGNFFIDVGVLDSLLIPLSAEGFFFDENFGLYLEKAIVGTGSLNQIAAVDLGGPGFVDVFLVGIDTVSAIENATYTGNLASLLGFTGDLVVFDTVDAIENASFTGGAGQPAAEDVQFYQVQDSWENIRDASDANKFDGGNLGSVVEVIVADDVAGLNAAFGDGYRPEVTGLALNTPETLWIPTWAAVGDVLPVSTWHPDALILIEDPLQSFIDDDFDNTFNWQYYNGNVEIAVRDNGSVLEQAYFDGTLPNLAGTIRVESDTLHLNLNVDSFLDGRAYYQAVDTGRVTVFGTADQLNASNFDNLDTGSS